MTGLFKELLNTFFHIDFASEIQYGSDQMYVNYPTRFATVTFRLQNNRTLEDIGDAVRIRLGLRPIWPVDDDQENVDWCGWYDFHYGINDLNGGTGDRCIEFTVYSDTAPDNEQKYSIDLTEEEANALYAHVNKLCKISLWRSCAELLTEARQKMERSDRHQHHRELEDVPSMETLSEGEE